MVNHCVKVLVNIDDERASWEIPNSTDAYGRKIIEGSIIQQPVFAYLRKTIIDGGV